MKVNLKQNNQPRNNRGSVLIVVLFVVSLMVLISGGFLLSVVSEASNTSRSYYSMSALNVAEAGVEEAVWELNFGDADFDADDGWITGGSTATKSDSLVGAENETIGEYNVTVSNYESSNPFIEVTAFVPNSATPKSQRTVKIGMESAQSPLFEMAAFGVNNLIMDQDFLTDSYNSTLGAYGGENVGSNGDIGTNSTSDGAITIAQNVTINGDIYVGPGSDPDDVITTSTGVAITGTQSALPEAYDFPDVTPPSGLTQMPNLTLGINESATISSSGEYDSITLAKDSVLTIDSDAVLYVKNTFSFDMFSQLQVTNGANVKIYLDDGLVFDKDADINNVSQDPTKFGIYGTADCTETIHVKKNGSYYGYIYAPHATINVNKEGAVYGALVGATVTIDKVSSIHYDEALESLTVGNGSGFSMASWQEL